MVRQPELRKYLSLPVNPEEVLQGGIVHAADAFRASPQNVPDAHFILLHSGSTELVHVRVVTVTRDRRLEEFLDTMLEFSNQYDFPFRPARIECNDHELSEKLSEALRDSGTAVTFVPQMPAWDKILNQLVHDLGSPHQPLPSLTDAGCTASQVREFAAAAAAFFRAAPWNHLDDADLIHFEAPRPPRYLKYAVILGAGAEVYGLGFYDTPEDHHKMMSQKSHSHELTLGSLTFESPDDVPPGDVALWREGNFLLDHHRDAFPLMTFLSPDGARRPNSEELAFATLVLKALAETTEEDIDSGRWTKRVECGGKRTEVTLAIPNLLNPPDRSEWLRRGVMPDQRGHERHLKLVHEFIEQHAATMSMDELNAAIEARFSHSLDEEPMPSLTARQRAEALYQQALDAFGRRRIQLARRAVAEEAAHVEAHLLLAEATRPVEQRLERFRQVKELAQQQLGPLMKEAGQFWSLHGTRPYMRACQGLAEALRAAGRAGEAIELYQEMLRLNPNDNQGVRYTLAPLLVAQDRDAEAIQLLGAHRETSAFWQYTKALIEFRRDGRPATGRRAMRAAFRENEHVVPLLQLGQPPQFPNTYAMGSPEEAAICIHELSEAWHKTKGYLEWMFGEYDLWQQEASKGRGAKGQQRKPSSKSKRPR